MRANGSRHHEAPAARAGHGDDGSDVHPVAAQGRVHRRPMAPDSGHAPPARLHQRPHPGRHLHRRLIGGRGRRARRGGVAALAAVVGPGLLAGLSDDDPPGITTYSLLGAQTGTQLLWVLLLSTAALIVFHELGARMGVATGEGLPP